MFRIPATQSFYPAAPPAYDKPVTRRCDLGRVFSGRKRGKRTASPDESTICLKCGYNLRGLDESGNCPECGYPISFSKLDRVLRNLPEETRRRIFRGFTFLLYGQVLLFPAIISLIIFSLFASSGSGGWFSVAANTVFALLTLILFAANLLGVCMGWLRLTSFVFTEMPLTRYHRLLKNYLRVAAVLKPVSVVLFMLLLDLSESSHRVIFVSVLAIITIGQWYAGDRILHIWAWYLSGRNLVKITSSAARISLMFLPLASLLIIWTLFNLPGFFISMVLLILLPLFMWSQRVILAEKMRVRAGSVLRDSAGNVPPEPAVATSAD